MTQVIKVGNEISWRAGVFYLLFDEQTPHLLTDITTGFRGDGQAVESKVRLWAAGKYRTLQVREQVSASFVSTIISCEEVPDDQRDSWLDDTVPERQMI